MEIIECQQKMVYSQTGLPFVLTLSGKLTTDKENKTDTTQHTDECTRLLPPPKIRQIWITNADLTCLKEREWLSDKVIDAYLTYLSNKTLAPVGFASCAFAQKLERDGIEGLSDWKGVSREDILKCRSFLFPCSIHFHWVLFAFEPRTNTLQVLDSLRNRQMKWTNKIKDFLESREFRDVVVTYPQVPRQNNADDCGVYLLEFASSIFRDAPIESFGSRAVSTIRERIRNELRVFIKRE